MNCCRLALSIGFAIATLVLAAATPARAERPPAAELLPEQTLAYIHLADVQETVKRFRETSLGRIAEDPAIRPLIEQLYGKAIEETQRIEERIGASLDELLSLLQGEFCLAVIETEQGPPGVVVILEAKKRMPILQTVLDHLEQRMVEGGGTRIEESAGDVSIVKIELPGREPRPFVRCERDETVVISNNLEIVQDILAAWEGGAEGRLAQNADFAAVMKRCTEFEQVVPDIEVFVDPIDLYARATRGNVQGQTILALFPALGLNGVRSFGGAVVLSTKDYDNVIHLHLLLDSPREAALKMVALEAGDTTPEPWVPEDVATYTTLHWDVPTTFTTFRSLFDQIRGEGELDLAVAERLSEPLGVEFEKDVLNALDGRLSSATWMVKPARMNSQAALIGIRLKDGDAFSKTFQKVIDRAGGEWRKEAHGGVACYYLPRPLVRKSPPEGPLVRQPQPCVTLLGDYLLMSDSAELLHAAIDTKKRDAGSLAEQLEFRLVASKLRAYPGGDRAGLIRFDRPEEAMRLMYELAVSETLRQRVRQQGENNRFFGTINQALTDHPLPPFAVIAQYLAPGGSLIINDDSGLHLTAFTLKRKQ